MIVFTGDTHADFTRFFNGNWDSMTKDDYVIICGDFGGVWNGSPHEDQMLDKLENLPFTLLFVDGNHECLNKETDVLTELGWMNIVDVYNSAMNIKVASYDTNTRELHFEYPLHRTRTYSATIINIDGYNYKQSVTPQHEVLLDGQKQLAQSLLGRRIKESALRHKVQYIPQEPLMMNNEYIELLVSVVMDGTIVDYSLSNPNSTKIRIQFHLKKERKIRYIERLLNVNDIQYTKRSGQHGDIYLCVYGNDGRRIYRDLQHQKNLPRTFANATYEQFVAIMTALQETDATNQKGRLVWRTTNYNDVSLMQELCLKFNCDMHVATLPNASGYTKDGKLQYVCSLREDKRLNTFLKISEAVYNDYAYCLTMPSGTLVTRYNHSVCITGNCFDRLYKYPVVGWNGGYVHAIRPHVLHLMRGEIFDIDGYKVFTMGGAKSHDISDGILDPNNPNYRRQKRRLDNEGKFLYRILGKSWWPEEQPTEDELLQGGYHLHQVNRKVDFIVSHEGPTSLVAQLGYDNLDVYPLMEFLEEVKQKCQYKRWFFGHHHLNHNFDDKHTMLWFGIVEVQ